MHQESFLNAPKVDKPTIVLFECKPITEHQTAPRMTQSHHPK